VDLSNVKARSNLNETAFFLPQLRVNEEGVVSIDFDMPEALTTWKFMGFAHGTKLQSGSIIQEVITQKELMIQPNAPRFLREGDKIAFTVKVTNLSDKEQTGSVALELYDAITDESRNAEFKNNENKKSFTVPAKQSRGFSWLLEVPYKPGFVKYKAVGATTTNSDGEEGLLPILSSRILVTESTPLPIRGPETKNFKFEKLTKSGDSKTLEHKGLTVEMTSNPAWYAIQALPYLIEFPHECSEQTFNRIYANKLAQHIANSNPKIRRVFDIWAKDELYNKGTALMSNLEKNQHLKSVTLMETPWVLDAKNENEQKHHIGVLFENARLNREIEDATKKLNNMQLSDGSFPWFPGGYGNTFITMYIMTGYGRLRNLGVEIDLVTALRCADFMDSKIQEYYDHIVLHDKEYKEHNHMDSTIAFYLYGRSFFLKDRPIPSRNKVAVDYFIEQAKKFWLKVPYRMSQAHIALGLKRFGDKTTPNDIVKSIKERSVTDDEMGRFWRENEIGYSWNRADIETQAMMIEMFSEITNDEEAVEDCKVWLLKQKQTQCWKTTKSTADAIYALILRGVDLLASDKVVKVYLNNQEVKPEKVEAGTGYYQKIYSGAEVKPAMGNIQVKKEDKGVAWGAVHWQYIEDMSKVTPFENNLKLKKSLYIKTNTEKGPVITPIKDGKVRVGDLVVVRIELRTDRDLEFVHMKDQRGSGMEPVNVISRYKWQDGIGYYEATKDAASHFYIDYLAKGTYVFEYELRVQLAGQYQTGMAEIMCMYAPEFNSHSESFMLNVEAQ
ncbi:MAG: alpha-2-macroglobulin family protein, partial [Candidatus Riflebacteria bacterium]|nr:alpha-2-macroglobulin family protein [Candidatus Riflebacteria bacterium]